MISADLLESMRETITGQFLPDNAVVEEEVSSQSTSSTTTTPQNNSNGRGGVTSLNPGNVRGGVAQSWRIRDNKVEGYPCRLEKINTPIPVAPSAGGVLLQKTKFLLHIRYDAQVDKGNRVIYTRAENGQKLTLSVTNVGTYSENIALPLEVEEEE